MPKRYNTPHRSRVVKTRLSEDEYADFTARLAPYGISQSEFLRQAIRRATIRPVTLPHCHGGTGAAGGQSLRGSFQPQLENDRQLPPKGA